MCAESTSDSAQRGFCRAMQVAFQFFYLIFGAIFGVLACGGNEIIFVLFVEATGEKSV